jgi:hypothetical protein
MKEEHYAHGWLAAVLPAAGRRFRVADETLAHVLSGAGGDLVDDEPDVEVTAAPEEIRGDAKLAVVTVDPLPRRSRARLVRAGSRVASSLLTRRRARRARSLLRQAGYEHSAVIPWDVTQRVRLAFLPPAERSLAERVPGRAVALGWRGEREPTVLEEVLAVAGRDAGLTLRPRWASIQAGTVLAATDSALLRVAIGPAARAQIQDQIQALTALREKALSPFVHERVPWLLAHGQTGLADWSLERMLPGSRPARELKPKLLEDCLTFLIGLQQARGNGAARSFAELARSIGDVSGGGTEVVVRSLGERLDEELAGVERGFGHGDFFAGNMLAEGNRLTGVLDWDAAGPGRLPVVDLLHLELTRVPYGTDDDWGRAVVDRLLPAARGGGSALVQRYASAVGLEIDPQLLEALVFAYWLEYVAYQLRAHPDRLSSPAWIAGNVELVARKAESIRKANAPGGGRGARTHKA